MIGAHVTSLGHDWITVVGERGQLLATGRRAFRGGYHVKLARGAFRGETIHVTEDRRVLDCTLSLTSE